ncbi:LysR family transcriptional regulator [Streptomyces albidoflavus]|uniref:LysR family transcriptional regulator n=1 Tax=Streptomyces albidoflavus TaxID=1886 RepID=UPI003528D33F
MSQAAVSAALGRLRKLFGDPLFVRPPAGMAPTARARSLPAPARRGSTPPRASSPSVDPRQPAGDLLRRVRRTFESHVVAGSEVCAKRTGAPPPQSAGGRPGSPAPPSAEGEPAGGTRR